LFFRRNQEDSNQGEVSQDELQVACRLRTRASLAPEGVAEKQDKREKAQAGNDRKTPEVGALI
jgi:hypothetical protein